MKLLRKEEMPENATAGDFAVEVAWVVGVTVASTIVIYVGKRGYRKIRSLRTA
jgi:hypothetical protein